MNGKWKMENGKWGVGAAFTVVALLALSGCDNVPTEASNYTPEPVLYGYLTNGEPVSEIYLERIWPMGSYYDPQLSGIRGAQMKIFSVGGGDTLHLTDDPNYRGRYIPAAGESLTPRGKTRYRIEVTTPAHENIWAETVVPDTFRRVEAYQLMPDGTRRTVQDDDTLTRNDPMLFFGWDGVDSAGGYQGLGVTLVPRDSLVPLDPDWTPEDSIYAEDRTKGGFMVVREDQRQISLPWIIFSWQGRHRLELLAISRDYYEYLFSQMRVQQGLIEKAETNIHGGIGVFSAITKHVLYIVMKKVE